RRKDIERQRALAENPVVKGADVELIAERCGRAVGQLADFQLADLVGKRLAGPNDVTVDLDDDVVVGLARILLHVFDGLIARPAKRVHAGINNKPARTPNLEAKLAEFLIRIGIKSELVTEALGIKSPAFDIGGIRIVLAPLGCVLEFL